MKPYLLLGFGNPDLTDDGIGAKLTRTIIKNLDPSRFDVLTDLVCNTDLLDRIEGYKILFVLDGMKTGIIEPGSLSEFNLKNYSGFLHLDNYHDVPFREIISLGKKLDMSITGIIHIIGIEIQEDKVFDRNLSPPLQSLFPELVNRIHRYIDKIITLEKIHSKNETF
jgi:hydrogenase maturation protease